MACKQPTLAISLCSNFSNKYIAVPQKRKIPQTHTDEYKHITFFPFDSPHCAVASAAPGRRRDITAAIVRPPREPVVAVAAVDVAVVGRAHAAVAAAAAAVTSAAAARVTPQRAAAVAGTIPSNADVGHMHRLAAASEAAAAVILQQHRMTLLLPLLPL